MRISDWSSDVCSSDLLYTPFGKPAYLFWLVEAGENGVRQPSLDQERSSCRDESGDCRYGKRMHSLRSRSEEHTSELQSLMRISYAVFCLKKKKITTNTKNTKQKQNKQIPLSRN